MQYLAGLKKVSGAGVEVGGLWIKKECGFILLFLIIITL